MAEPIWNLTTREENGTNLVTLGQALYIKKKKKKKKKGPHHKTKDAQIERENERERNLKNTPPKITC
jgi:hypothetical protein